MINLQINSWLTQLPIVFIHGSLSKEIACSQSLWWDSWTCRCKSCVSLGCTRSYHLSGSDGKKSTCNAGDLGQSWVGKTSGEGNGYPFQYFCLRIPWTERNLAGYIVHGVAKSQTSLSDLHFHFQGWKWKASSRVRSEAGLPLGLVAVIPLSVS